MYINCYLKFTSVQDNEKESKIILFLLISLLIVRE